MMLKTAPMPPNRRARNSHDTPHMGDLLNSLVADWGPLSSQSRNRALTDVVAAGNAALRLASFEAFAGLLLLVRREDRRAAEFDAVRLGVGSAARGAFEDAAAFELRRNAKDGENDLGKVGGRIKERLGQ